MSLETNEVWEKFSDALRGFILKRVGDEHCADDILQDAFIKIHMNLWRLEDEGKLQPWLYQIARNTIIDYFRSRKVAEEWPKEVSEMVSLRKPGKNLNRELAACVKTLMERLPDKDREAIEMTEFKGLTHKELSEKLDMSFSGEKSRVQRARGKMKNLLLQCCAFELDRRGNILDYEPKSSASPKCCPEEQEFS